MPQRKTTNRRNVTRVQQGWLMVLRQGDDVMQQLESFTQQENIAAASFSGLGFGNVTFGIFNAATKQYDPREFRDVEIAGMNGTIAWKDGKPAIHMHGVGTGKDFVSHGGHILACTVGTGSVEIMITMFDKKLERKRDEKLGADVLQLE